MPRCQGRCGDHPSGIEDSKQLQHDPHSLRGAFEKELFEGWTGKTAETEKARGIVAAWDGSLKKESAAAAIYTAWRSAPDPKAIDYYRPRDEKLPLVEAGLVKAIAQLTKDQGAYGNLLPLWDRGEYFPMAYSRARVDREAAHKLSLRPAARPAATSSARR